MRALAVLLLLLGSACAVRRAPLRAALPAEAQAPARAQVAPAPAYLGHIKKAAVSRRSVLFNGDSTQHLVLTCEGASEASAWRGTTTLSWFDACADPEGGCRGGPPKGQAALGPRAREAQGSWMCGAAADAPAAGAGAWGETANCPTANSAAGRAACLCVPIVPPAGAVSAFLKLDYADALPAGGGQQAAQGRHAALKRRIVEYDRRCALAVHVGELTAEKNTAVALAARNRAESEQLRREKVHAEQSALRHEQAARDSDSAKTIAVAESLALTKALDEHKKTLDEHVSKMETTCPLTIALTAAVAQPPQTGRYADLPLDCTRAVLPHRWTVRARSQDLFAYLIACTYSSGEQEPPANGGPPLPPVKVPVLVFYSVADDNPFVFAYALAARGHDEYWLPSGQGAGEVYVKVAGYELNGAVDPVGKTATAKGKILSEKVEFVHTKSKHQDAQFMEMTQAMRSVGAVAYICGGNTGRSPVAEAVAASVLGEAGLYDVAPVFSRLAGDARGPEGKYIEADVRHALARLGPNHWRLREHLDLHRARPSSGIALAFARVILTASEGHANTIKEKMKEHFDEAKREAKKKTGANMDAVGNENVFTIKEWIDAARVDKDIEDPFVVKEFAAHAKVNAATLLTLPSYSGNQKKIKELKESVKATEESVPKAFETMVRDMLKYVPAGALRAAHGLFPINDVFAKEA